MDNWTEAVVDHALWLDQINERAHDMPMLLRVVKNGLRAVMPMPSDDVLRREIVARIGLRAVMQELEDVT